MYPFSLGAGTPSVGVPDFRTDPNLSLEEKREIAGDNYREAAYEMEKDLEKIRQSEEKTEMEREAIKNRSDDKVKGMAEILEEWRNKNIIKK